jgi:hypothetical protein
MKVVKRLVQKVRPDKWEMLEKTEKKWDAAENRLGFPSKTRYRYISGGDDNIHIVERHWESFAAMEAAFEQWLADPEIQTLLEETVGYIDGGERQFLAKLD